MDYQEWLYPTDYDEYESYYTVVFDGNRVLVLWKDI